MSRVFDELPPRLNEQHGQADVVERIASQTLRKLQKAKPVSERSLNRIALAIDERVRDAQPARRHRYRLAFAAAAFLLGGTTVASANHLDVIPRWLAHVMSPLETRERPQAPRASTKFGAKTRTLQRAPSQANDQAVPTAATTEVTSEATSEVTSEARAAPVAESIKKTRPSPATKGLRPSRQALAMLPSDRYPPPAANPALPSSPSAADRDLAGTSPTTPAAGEPGRALVEPVRSLGTSAFALRAAPPTATWARAEVQGSARYLGEAVRALRVERSPRTALAILDRHAEELARDAFANETISLRVEARLALHEPKEALRLLDEVALGDAATSRALLVARGRLRAAANRCTESIADFERVLASAGKPSKQALEGHALCKKALGDEAGARADLERYRREFPGDPNLSELEEQLQSRR